MRPRPQHDEITRGFHGVDVSHKTRGRAHKPPAEPLDRVLARPAEHEPGLPDGLFRDGVRRFGPSRPTSPGSLPGRSAMRLSPRQGLDEIGALHREPAAGQWARRSTVICGRPRPEAWVARPAAGRYGVTVTTENMPALKWPGMLQTKR
jgi:hypothetical protein